MDNKNSVKRVILAFLNSAEKYFHTKTIIQEQVKQPRDVYGPMSDRPERWNYKDKRDITANDLESIAKTAVENLDKELYNIIPSTAIHASLGYTIHTYEKSAFQSKIDTTMYNFLYNLIETKLK